MTTTTYYARCAVLWCNWRTPTPGDLPWYCPNHQRPHTRKEHP